MKWLQDLDGRTYAFAGSEIYPQKMHFFLFLN